MSANSQMITNMYSECWWLALFFLTHWLTLCFMPAVWCTHSSLMILQSFFEKWPIQINYYWWKSMKKANMSRRVSGLGKENAINHKMKKRSRNSCRYQTGLTTYFTYKSIKTDCYMISNDYCIILHRLNSHLQRPSFASLSVCCVVNLWRWVPGLLSPQIMQ